MDWSRIVERIATGEDEHTELKRGFDPRRWGHALAAMANSDGGVVIMGADDRGRIVGVAEPAERVQERLTAFLQSGLSEPVRARPRPPRGHGRPRALGGGAEAAGPTAAPVRRPGVRAARPVVGGPVGG